MKIRFDQAAPYEVEEVDVPFARPEGKELQARVYRPRGDADIPLAALVDVHGGAWSRGDRMAGAFHGRALAASGLLVVSLDFRQGSEAKHPAASADIVAGVRYVRANASVAFVLALYPVADPLARFRYVVGRQDDGSGFDAKRLIAAHHGYFSSEAQMAEASVTRIVTSREARALPPVWVAQPELDDNVPAAITEAFVQAYQQAGGPVERVHFPGARHGFIQQPSADADKAIALMRDFIGRQLIR